MSTLVRIFNTKDFSLLFVCWLVGFMIWHFLLRYLIPKFSLFCLCVGWLVGWLVGWFYDMSTLVRIYNTKVFSFLFVCCWLVVWLVGWLIGWFYDMSTLVRIFYTNVFFFCLCVGWLVL